ncbi:MAG: DUF1003 domain-containing protein [Caldilineaceae bacterium]|nr:DUF1003 domain-containing protein [Caldilineaceae bacterium]
MAQPLHFPKPFTHNHPPVVSVNELEEEQLSFGQRAADAIAGAVGSWRFIIIQSALLLIWIILNITAYVQQWDPYPFILMNLLLSTQAAYTAPMIMMSQNRQAIRDRLEAHNDYIINQKAEEEIRAIMEHLVAQDEALAEIYRHLQQMGRQSGTAAGKGEPL